MAFFSRLLRNRDYALLSRNGKLLSVLALVCVDYDNVYDPGGVQPTPELLAHDLLWLAATAAAAGAEEVRIRLYGGWQEAGTTSRRADAVAQILPGAGFLPAKLSGGQLVRGQIELATRLVEVDLDLGDTYVRRKGPPQARLQQTWPEGCQRADDSCPARILRAFTQRGTRACAVETCAVTSADAFVTHEQKMVDTMMACDLLGLATFDGRSAEMRMLVSSDRDMLPVAVTLGAKHGHQPVVIVDPDEGWSDEDRRLLIRAGVRVIDMGNVVGA